MRVVWVSYVHLIKPILRLTCSTSQSVSQSICAAAHRKEKSYIIQPRAWRNGALACQKLFNAYKNMILFCFTNFLEIFLLLLYVSCRQTISSLAKMHMCWYLTLPNGYTNELKEEPHHLTDERRERCLGAKRKPLLDKRRNTSSGAWRVLYFAWLTRYFCRTEVAGVYQCSPSPTNPPPRTARTLTNVLFAEPNRPGLSRFLITCSHAQQENSPGFLNLEGTSSAAFRQTPQAGILFVTSLPLTSSAIIR